MKLAIIPCLLLLSSLAQPAFAEPSFEKAKQEMISSLDTRIQALTTAKGCASAAQDLEGLKKCHAALKEDHLEMREEHLEKRKTRMEEHMKKLEEQKAKMREMQKGK